MTDNEARPVRRSRHKLLALIASTMDVEESEVAETASFESFGSWDSQREVELAMMLEFEYGISVNDEQLSNLRTVRDVRDLLAAQGIHDA